MDRYSETVVEFYDENAHLTISTGKRKYVNKIKKFAKDYPDVVKYIENKDGSVCATMPIEWFKFPSPKRTREMTEEQKEELAERMRQARNIKKENNNA